MTEQQSSQGTIAGYRLLRTLARGSRADLYLGAASTGTVVLKVFREDVDRASVAAEIEALGRHESAHLVRLLDLSSDGREIPTLVLERVHRGSVAGLLRERDTIESGEAVTLLAPLAGLVSELHSVGVAHGRIGAASVHLGSGGAPVLLGLGHATLFAPGLSPAALDDHPAARGDRDDLAELGRGILERIRGGDLRVRDLQGWIEQSPRVSEFAVQLEERLFALTEPLPVAFTRSPAAAPAVPARIAPPAPIPLVEHSAAFESSLPAWLPIALIENPALEIRRRALALLRGVRKRFWVAAAAVLVGLLVALAVIPSGSRHTSVIAAPRASSTVPTETPVVLPADPLLALAPLLSARVTCFRDLSVLCLDGVDEASSAAFASDAAAIQQIQEGGEVPPASSVTAAAPSLVERLGDSALISLGANSKPASVLVIRTEAGWRIRDYLSGTRATGSSPVPSG
jgi:eukaryotic-like serine/threonine-protein kinase